LGEQIEELAQFVARTGWDDMPERYTAAPSSSCWTRSA
jgi:hypothetical protein